MASLFSYLLTIFAVFFWIFRVIVSLAYSLSWDFAFQPINPQLEIVVLFATLPCLFLVVKRNLIGATVYLGMYVAYFGTELFNIITGIVNGQNGIGNFMNALVIFIGILIPLLLFFDILLNKDRTAGRKDKKTDWFYTNKDYDREFDERADRNQYRT